MHVCLLLAVFQCEFFRARTSFDLESKRYISYLVLRHIQWSYLEKYLADGL